MMLERIVSRQLLDVRHRGYEQLRHEGQGSGEPLIPLDIDPFFLSCSSDYTPAEFPPPVPEFVMQDWPHCGLHEIELAKASYLAFATKMNTQNAIEVAGFAFANFNPHLAGQWYQLAAVRGRSEIAMAELSGIFLCAMNDTPDKEAGSYWYIKGNRLLSGMLLKGARRYALELADKTIHKLEVCRRFTDPTNRATVNFFCRPPGRSVWKQFHPLDFEREGQWSAPTQVRSVSSGVFFESASIAEIYFNIDSYTSEEQLQLSNNFR